MLLLPGDLAVILAMTALPRLALLALEAVPLLVTMVATNKTLADLVPTVPLCVHPSRLGNLASVLFGISITVQLGPRSTHRSRVTPRCRLPACSIIGLNHGLVPSLLVYNVEQVR